jgi:Zn-dependent protease with chaperone function
VTSVEGFVLTFLANAIWQAPLLALGGLGAARLLGTAPAAYRFRLWTVVLVLAVAAPLASAARSRDRKTPSRLTMSRGAPWGDIGYGGRGAAPTRTRSLSLALEYALPRWGGPATLAYLALVAARVLWLGRAWGRTRRIVRAAHPSPPSLHAAIAECASAFGRFPEVRISGEVTAPMTFGLRQPMIVLPPWFVRDARPERARGALAHELAHVVRRDCALNLACELLAAPLSMHPAVRFVRRRSSGAREAACDEAAAAFVGGRAYARTLFEVAAASRRGIGLAGALGALDGNDLEDRMKKILDGGRSMGRRQATLSMVVLVAGLSLVGRLAAGAAVAVSTEAGPSDMVGTWTAEMPGGSLQSRPAAEMTIALTARGPEIALVLYRYRVDDGKTDVERPPVVQHSVENGVLRFRTRVDDFQLRKDDPPAPMEADWQFTILGADTGELRMLRNSRQEAEESAGRGVPSRPPLPMKRRSKP